MADDQSHNPFAGGDAYDGGGDAYGDTAYGGGGMPPPPPASTVAAVAMDAYSNADPETKAAVNAYAADAATEVITGAYEEATNDMNDGVQNSAGPHSMPEAPSCLQKTLNWLPVRYFAAFGGLLMSTLPILDFFIGGNDIEFASGVLLCYLILCGFVIIFIELPSFVLTRPVQLKIFFWVKILSRTWGRAWFYVLLSLIAFATFEAIGEVTATLFVGVYFVIIIILMFIVSRMAATKYVRMYDFIAAGKEGEERDKLFEAKFDELDMSGEGSITSQEIVTLATQAGRELANAECHAIYSFLDESCNGKISRDDFLIMFATYNTKQKFL